MPSARVLDESFRSRSVFLSFAIARSETVTITAPSSSLPRLGEETGDATSLPLKDQRPLPWEEGGSRKCGPQLPKKRRGAPCRCKNYKERRHARLLLGVSYSFPNATSLFL